MMKQKALCLLLMLCLLAGLTGCAVKLPQEESAPPPTLPPAEARFTAPDGDGIISGGGEYKLYFPSADGLHLVSRTTVIEPANLIDTTEMIVRQMIAFQGDEEARKLGGSRPLDLYGAHPIEISGGVCTVNLSSSMLQLSLSEYYKHCLALSALVFQGALACLQSR